MDVQLPQQKKSRGTIQSEMSHLSLQPSSDVESAYSDLGDLYSGPSPSLILPTMHLPPSSRTTSVSPPNVLPDPGSQYNAHRDPEGGGAGERRTNRFPFPCRSLLRVGTPISQFPLQLSPRETVFGDDVQNKDESHT